MNNDSMSTAAFNRLPIYLKALYSMKEEGKVSVSSVSLAQALGLNASIVKKDLSTVKTLVGKPKIGYFVEELIADVEDFLGYNSVKNAVLVGAGKLGQALIGFSGFSDYGLNIVAGFDADENKRDMEIHGKKILAMSELVPLINQLEIKIAIITVPQNCAQNVADILVGAGIRAVWNFTQEHIKVPDDVALKNENMASSLAVLSGQLSEILRREKH